jgi:hypothetical protein
MILENHLFPGPAGGPAQAPLKLPDAAAHLALGANGAALTALPDHGQPASGVIVEPVRGPRHQRRLLVTFIHEPDPRVNGELAPPFALLKPGDFFQWAPGLGFRVAVLAKPEVGPPPPALVGRPCPVCRVPFVAESTCFTCACGVVVHVEPDGPEALQCAQLSGACPHCRQPFVLTEAHVGLPNDEE